MTVSLIIATYNWPRALHLCLESVMRQSVMPTEILIADDGSKADTRQVVEFFAALSPVPVRHIWHEDNGFRLATIRNKAIAASHCDYIIQIDGDIVLGRHFIQDHIIHARAGSYAAGSRGLITEELTRKALEGVRVSFFPFRKGVRNTNNVLRIPFIAPLYCYFDKNKAVRGCNMAFWRDDLIRVNGYDETFVGWGSEDGDIADRLGNAGIRKRPLKYRGIAFHLYHKQADRTQALQNEQIRKQNKSTGKSRCEIGLSQYLTEESGITALETAVGKI